MTLEFTGERFTTECQGEMIYEHWHRYLIAADHVVGKSVLDIASGEGYGTHLLSRVATSIVGVDVSDEAVAHASSKYRSPNLAYVAARCTQIPWPDESFDVVVSFETIEHIHEQEAFLREVKRLLKPDGLFIISSPNRVEYSEKTGYKNEYHVKELDRAELKSLLDAHWATQKWFAQRPVFQSMVWPLDQQEIQSSRVLHVDGKSAMPGELYYLVFCANTAKALDDVSATLSLVADSDNTVYEAWSRTYRDNVALHERMNHYESDARVASSAAQPAIASDAGEDFASRETWVTRILRRLLR
jgi:SAM-dependent methyltransferase